MANRGGILRIAVCAFICLFVIVTGVYSFAFSGIEAKKPESKTEFYEIRQFEAVSDTKQNTADNTSSVQESTAVSVASNGVVAGGIIERFISPYTEKSNYNNVYIKNSTDLDIDIKSLLSAPLEYKIEKNGEPQVLIIHTHTTESFMRQDSDTYTKDYTSRTTDENYNMTALGKIVSDILNNAGIVTVHDTTVHDFPQYNGSYSRAAETITSNLKKYPSIKIVIDMHRDAISSGDTDKVKLTSKINGRKAAQIMLVMGSQSGGVKNFPDYKENLKLAFKLQQMLEVMYPSLARPLSLTSKNYNESLSHGSMLIEIGTDGNTIDEVRYSAEMLGSALVNLFNTLG